MLGKNAGMRILVSGSHGLIGSALVSTLEKLEHQVVRLARGFPLEREIPWNPYTGEAPAGTFEGFDVVVHLGGASIGEKRWTQRQKQKIWDSRVVSTELLAKNFLELTKPPKLWICASAAGYYGNRGDELLTEQSSQGEGFLAELCAKWEESSRLVLTPESKMRVVNLRSGVVLDPYGGILDRQIPLFRLGLGGRLGTGMQWFPWISLLDEINAIIHIINTPSISGPVNLVSPLPATNSEFTFAMGNALKRPTFIPTPQSLLSLVFGKELTDELMATSQRIYPGKLIESGFQFQNMDIHETLKEMLSPRKPEPPVQDEDQESEIDQGPQFKK